MQFPAHRQRHSRLFGVALGLLIAPVYAQDSSLSKCEFSQLQNRWVCQDEGAANKYLDYDWVPKIDLSDRERESLAPGCEGMFKDPFAELHFSDESIGALPLEIEADNAAMNGADKAELEGKVRVSQGPRSIGAESMSYDRNTDEAKLSGGVVIRQPGMLIRGQEATVSTVKHEGKFSDALFVLHGMHMRGSASSISQEGDDKIVLKNGMITSCEPGSRAWSLQGQELAVEKGKGQGYGKNVVLKLGKVPVFYLPYISFPVGDERRSGFLFPSLSSSDDGGLDIALPYYLNLAPNYDATITPRYISGRGPMFETEFRHMNSFSVDSMYMTYLPNDSGGGDPDVQRLIDNQQITESQGKPHMGDNRWLMHFDQIGGKRTGWFSNLDYTKVSDEDYFRDLGTSSFDVSSNTYLNQRLAAGHVGERWNIQAKIQDYQLLLLDLAPPYRQVPQISAEGFYSPGLGSISLYTQYTRFDLRPEDKVPGKLTGERWFGDYRWRMNAENSWGFIRPEVGYKALHYNIDETPGETLRNASPSVGAAQASLDLGVVFENPRGHFLQTFEPRVYYLFREYENQNELYNATLSGTSINFDTSARTFSYYQLYRDTRFSGSDRLDDANQVTIGATTRWYSRATGLELFQLSLGQINHFRDRRIGLNSEISATDNASEIAADFSANLNSRSAIYSSLIYDDAAQKLSRLSTGYHYASSDQSTLFNTSYSYVRRNPEVQQSEVINQLDFAFIKPVAERWSLMGRSNYDFENKQELETFLGIEYNDCCYRVRVLARRWLDSNIARLVSDRSARFDQGLFFELHLKGLGGSGAKVDSILEDAIYGYRDREKRMNPGK